MIRRVLKDVALTVLVGACILVLGVFMNALMGGSKAEASVPEGLPRIGMECSNEDCYVYDVVNGTISHVTSQEAYPHYPYLEPVYSSKEGATEARQNGGPETN